jgi:chromosome partitioning protein
LLDGDDTRNATVWSQRGKGFPFKVADEVQAARLSRNYEHTVIDTGQRPKRVDLKALAEGCDVLVIPAVPASLDTDGLVLTLQALQEMGAENYKVLLTKVPPAPEPEGPQLREDLTKQKIPLFRVDIPRLKAFEKAAAAGVTVNEVADPRADRAWDAYAAAGKELLKYGRTK